MSLVTCPELKPASTLAFAIPLEAFTPWGGEDWSDVSGELRRGSQRDASGEQQPEVPQTMIKQEEVPTHLEDIGEPGYIIQMRQRVKTSTPPGAWSLHKDADEEATPREQRSCEARDTDTAPTTPTRLCTVIKPTGKSTSISHRAQARRAQLMPPPNPEREGDVMAAAPDATGLHSMELRNTTVTSWYGV
ncbi:predicted protein [Postia placenta Mad-698-R]|uniref:Uncharacterized protein n=1 Tax=Postia placenta MAD-698-R-SB12 TaxID=670580 RepID=A0A1X6N700_9APHY|nr:hypothetical protein POSPLADRAFT_1137843 [Postia placenta MAD-698-R-SB12]EED85592.1 predicted protein [Postia placenta Mad-698-R]OSX64391.1 hypothetical protein POSPLADRAFT_1137843 [Postia placenta MAD-698-R-SB12]